MIRLVSKANIPKGTTPSVLSLTGAPNVIGQAVIDTSKVNGSSVSAAPIAEDQSAMETPEGTYCTLTHGCVVLSFSF